MVPAAVPEAARRDVLADDERRQVLVEERLKARAADARGVAEAGPGQAGIGPHIGDEDLDVRHVVDRIAPGGPGQRQAGEDRLDGFDAQGRLVVWG
jgi:hypothetical protein